MTYLNAALVFAATSLLIGAASTALSAPKQSEQAARAVCSAQAKKLKLKIPPGACEDPRSGFRIKMLTSHREMCAKDMMHASGVLKCHRSLQSDK
jgi:hypothetical protein